ncbi:hypothetical protein [Neptunicella sp.]
MRRNHLSHIHVATSSRSSMNVVQAAGTVFLKAPPSPHVSRLVFLLA